MNDIVCPLQTAARLYPDHTAMVLPHRTYTWREFDTRVSAVASHLTQQGFCKGQTGALSLPPGEALLHLLMAMIRNGMIAFPLDPRFPESYRQEILAQVKGAVTIHPGNECVFLQAPSPFPASSDEMRLPLDRPATLVLTSGSSGKPKAALHALGNHYHSALRSNANIALGPEDRWLMSLPMHHVAGLGVWFRCLLSGAAAIVPGAGQTLGDALRQYRPTHLSLVSTQLYRLLRDPEMLPFLRDMKAVLLGGSGIPEPLLREAHAAGLPLHTSYGLTEMATQVATTAPGDSLDRLLTSGRPLHPDSLRFSAAGEIQVRGDTLFLGYVEGDALRRPLNEEGWFCTGDCGFLDAMGYLHVTGRMDNMFIAGGENIQPEEIEAALCRIDGVLEAMVTSVPHVEFGNTPVAFVRVAAGHPLDGIFLSAQLALSLPKFKIPRHYLPWPEEAIPEGGKLPRRVFAALARQRIVPETPA